jgi:1-deoxy-D-xylulose-5-phosphate synthase
VLADAGLTEQDVARRIAEWTARLAERGENHVIDVLPDSAGDAQQ